MWFVAVGAITALVGVCKSLDASSMNEQSKEIIDDAILRHESALRLIESKRLEIQNQLANLGKEKLITEAEYLLKFAQVYGKIRRITYRKIIVSDSMDSFIDDNTKVIEQEAQKSLDVVSTGFKGLTVGTSVSYGMFATTKLLAHASTGAAISSLSGAAATNATLSWLGGGSLAVGGAGMAGGAAVLGGLVVGPALMIMGFSAASEAEKNLTEAKRYASEVNKYIEQIHLGVATLTAIEQRICELNSTILSVRDKFKRILIDTEKMIDLKIKNYKKLTWYEKNIKRINPLDIKSFSDDENKKFESFTHFGLYLYALVKTPVLNDESKINSQLGEILEFYPQLNDEVIYPILNKKAFDKVRNNNEIVMSNGRNKYLKKKYIIFIIFMVLFFITLYIFSKGIIGLSSFSQAKEEVPVIQESYLPKESINLSLPPQDKINPESQKNLDNKVIGKEEIIAPELPINPPTAIDAYNELYADAIVTDNLKSGGYVKKMPEIIGSTNIGDDELWFIGIHKITSNEYNNSYVGDISLDIIGYIRNDKKIWTKALQRKGIKTFGGDRYFVDKYIDDIRILEISGSKYIYYFNNRMSEYSENISVLSFFVKKDIENNQYTYIGSNSDGVNDASVKWDYSIIDKDSQKFLLFRQYARSHSYLTISKILDSFEGQYSFLDEVCSIHKSHNSSKLTNDSCRPLGFTNLSFIGGEKITQDVRK
jgi:hypothetical protein